MINNEKQEKIIEELIRAQKEKMSGSSFIDVDASPIRIDSYIDILLNNLVELNYEEELREVWHFEIGHINDYFCKDLKNALQNHDAYAFVIESRGEALKSNYIKSHWDELDKMIDTLYNLCGLNVVEIYDREQVEDIIEVENPDEN